MRIVARHSGKCLDVALAGHRNGDPIHQWECIGADNQQWHLDAAEHDRDWLYRIVAKHSGKCVDVALASHVNEARAHQWEEVAPALNQQWKIEPIDDTYCKIVAAHSGHCLQVGGQSYRGNGSAVNQLPYVAGDNQQWMFIPDLRGFSSRFRIVNKATRRELEGDRDQWQLEPAGSMFYRVIDRRSGHSDGDEWLLIPELSAKPVTDGLRNVYWIEGDHAIVAPDVESFDLRSIERISPREIDRLPIWPYLGPSSFDDRVLPLIKVITRQALWSGRRYLGEAVPAPKVPTGARHEWEKAASVFLSHSSNDRVLAKRLAADLRSRGIRPWLDEAEIRVGDSIAAQIQRGLQETDFIVVLLSRASVESGWVEMEWQSRIDAEAAQRQVFVLPVRCDDCAIPPLLRNKKFADFTRGYDAGLQELVDAIRAHRAEPPIALTAPAPPLTFVTEGGTSTIFFSIANASHGSPVVLNALSVNALQYGTLFAGIPRIDLATLIDQSVTVEPKQAAINLSSDDFFILSREVIRIEPGEVVPFSLRLCSRSIDNYVMCRLAVHFLTSDGRSQKLWSDCVYLLKGGDTYTPGGNLSGPDILRRVLIRAALPVEQLLRTAPRDEYTGRFRGELCVDVEGTEYHIYDDMLET